ncbi:unnamed protein product [Nesidiocoris tenuis]|uniref:Uncharacterized protein n=1 Tax=Nesidiocoris tenuis TaxID=355587 RepID=A0A6H5HKX8_9HEMI|nr:unnamed protein product [Nesidiocoris tenuis]
MVLAGSWRVARGLLRADRSWDEDMSQTSSTSGYRENCSLVMVPLDTSAATNLSGSSAASGHTTIGGNGNDQDVLRQRKGSYSPDTSSQHSLLMKDKPQRYLKNTCPRSKSGTLSRYTLPKMLRRLDAAKRRTCDGHPQPHTERNDKLSDVACGGGGGASSLGTVMGGGEFVVGDARRGGTGGAGPPPNGLRFRRGELRGDIIGLLPPCRRL